MFPENQPATRMLPAVVTATAVPCCSLLSPNDSHQFILLSELSWATRTSAPPLLLSVFPFLQSSVPQSAPVITALPSSPTATALAIWSSAASPYRLLETC